MFYVILPFHNFFSNEFVALSRMAENLCRSFFSPSSLAISQNIFSAASHMPPQYALEKVNSWIDVIQMGLRDHTNGRVLIQMGTVTV